MAQTLAFPGAEGGGKYTSGGRGGKVIKVTNLNDSGPGSLRDAIDAKGPRIIIFEVDGTIDLKSKLIIKNDSVTIAGQSAPGDGICLKGYPFYVRANNVIIRYIRSRMGDVNKVIDDALGAMYVKDLIMDHCSASWSVDECISVYKSENVTVQWCIASHSLSKSVHTKGAHGFGGIWGGKNATFHHNLLADHSSRNPRLASDGFSPVDFRNNVVFNWGYKAAYGGGRGGRINFVSNYYKPGPATRIKNGYFILDPAEDSTSSYYLSNNILEGNDSVTLNNWLGVSNIPFSKTLTPFEIISINEDSPKDAYSKVLKYSGCSFRRDDYDRRVINEVETGKAIDGETYGGGNKGIIDSQTAVGGWPELKNGVPQTDSDNDGIPDTWELNNHLNPKDAGDATIYSLSKKYTNIEVYLNSILDGTYENFTLINDSVNQVVLKNYASDSISDFCRKLKPVGRILETSGYYVWCCAPIYGKDGKVHVFYSRWPEKYGMGGWIHKSEIAHAVADKPEGPYRYIETVLAPRSGFFDATTCHNPHIEYKNGTYYLFYMGNSDGTINTKRIGLAISKSLYGPWKRTDKPILEPGVKGSWDDCCTTNPAYVETPGGKSYLYYKSWNKEEYDSAKGEIRANRKYGLAVADKIDGKYQRYAGNPVIDFSVFGGNKQVEDAFIYLENGTFKMLMRDMGYYDNTVGLYFESKDGIHWSSPKIAWLGADAYIKEPQAPAYLKRFGRFERPQLLLKDGKPEYMFNATQGGYYDTSSGFVFKISE